MVNISAIINDSLNAMNWDAENNIPLKARYGVLFNKVPSSFYDDWITACVNGSNWLHASETARIAEIDNYTSSTMVDKVKTILDNMSMTGNLPVTYQNFRCTDRFALSLYRYAQQLNYRLDKWKINDAYNDFKSVYNTAGKPFITCDPPSTYFCINYGPRWYDESAETLDVFLKFYELGVAEAFTYAQTVWQYILTNIWANTYFKYAVGWGGMECEVQFHTIALRLRHWWSQMTNFNYCLTDIWNRLLTNKFSSPQWNLYGIRHHAEGDATRRLWNTFCAFVVLHQYYPLMNSESKANFISMLKDGTRACDGLINESGLYHNDVKKFSEYSGGIGTDSNTGLGCGLLLLQAIIPDSGYLMIPVFEERYEDGTCSLNKYFRYDPVNKKIQIPVRNGILKFQFGSASPVSANFENDAVYEIQFTDDWNSVTSVTHITNLDTDLIYSTSVVSPPPPPPLTERKCIDLGKAWGFRRWSVPQNVWK